MNDDKSVFVQPQVVNNVKEKTTSMPNKQLSSLRASSLGAPRVTGVGKGRGEGELSLSFPFFLTARASRRADRFCCPQANSNPNYGACIKSCFSGFTNRFLQKRQILKLLRASPEPPFYTERISSVLLAVLCLAWFICRAARQALFLEKFPAGIPASRYWDLSLLRRCV